MSVVSGVPTVVWMTHGSSRRSSRMKSVCERVSTLSRPCFSVPGTVSPTRWVGGRDDEGGDRAAHGRTDGDDLVRVYTWRQTPLPN